MTEKTSDASETRNSSCQTDRRNTSKSETNRNATCSIACYLNRKNSCAKREGTLSLIEQDVVRLEPALDCAGVEPIAGINDKSVHLLFLQDSIERIGQLNFAAHTRLDICQ